MYPVRARRNPQEMASPFQGLQRSTGWIHELPQGKTRSLGIELIAAHMLAYKAEANTTLLEEGQRNPFMCLLVKGRLAVYKNRDAFNSESTHLATILPGRTIGEMSLIDGQPHSASVITTAPSTLLVLTRKRLNDLSRTHPKTANRLILKIAQLLSHRLRQTSGKLIDYL